MAIVMINLFKPARLLMAVSAAVLASFLAGCVMLDPAVSEYTPVMPEEMPDSRVTIMKYRCLRMRLHGGWGMY